MKYRETVYMAGEFTSWSNIVKALGDKRLAPEDRDPAKWTKIVILRPIGPSDAQFSMGFIAYNGYTAICDTPRRVVDGPFGMRMGPEDCSFFIAAKTNQPLGLDVSRLTNGGYIEVY